jgi:hypothetical protein
MSLLPLAIVRLKSPLHFDTLLHWSGGEKRYVREEPGGCQGRLAPASAREALQVPVLEFSTTGLSVEPLEASRRQT